jgi:predicted component of type VI protein secretion system
VLGLVEEERRGCRSEDEVEWWLTASFSFSVVFFRFFPDVGWCCFCLGVFWFGRCPGSGGGGGGGLR